MYDLVCIGASWGGLEAIGRVLADLPAEIDLPIAIAQHRHPDSHEGALAELLQAQTDRPVLDVEDKMPIEPRRVYIAPPNYHLLVERGSFALSVDDRIKFARPSIDVLFETAADAYGRGVIGIVLTGMGKDGARGLKEIRKRGGHTLAQDEASCVVFGMPKEAVELGAAELVLGLDSMVPMLLKWVDVC